MLLVLVSCPVYSSASIPSPAPLLSHQKWVFKPTTVISKLVSLPRQTVLVRSVLWASSSALEKWCVRQKAPTSSDWGRMLRCGVVSTEKTGELFIKSKSGGWKSYGTSQVKARTKQVKSGGLNTCFPPNAHWNDIKGFFFKGISSQQHTKRQRRH